MSIDLILWQLNPSVTILNYVLLTLYVKLKMYSKSVVYDVSNNFRWTWRWWLLWSYRKKSIISLGSPRGSQKQSKVEYWFTEQHGLVEHKYWSFQMKCHFSLLNFLFLLNPK